MGKEISGGRALGTHGQGGTPSVSAESYDDGRAARQAIISPGRLASRTQPDWWLVVRRDRNRGCCCPVALGHLIAISVWMTMSCYEKKRGEGEREQGKEEREQEKEEREQGKEIEQVREKGGTC